MASVIRFFLDLQIQLKLYHWQTTSYARHIATDQLLEKISDLSDKFIEVYFGKYGRQKTTKDDKILLTNYSDADIVKYLTAALNYINQDISKHLKNSNNSDLQNILDEICAEINKTLYLFTLK